MCDSTLQSNRLRKFCSKKCFIKKEEERREKNIPQILKDLKELKTFVAVAKKYQVSDNAVRKWLRAEGLDPKQIGREIKNKNL